jgi:hypothetical protein
MANVKYSAQDWSRAREYFEAGLSLSDITEKTGISKPQISKRSSQEKWSKETEKKQLIVDAVRLAVAKETLNETELSVHEELVDERTRYVIFFNNAAIQNVKEAMTAPCDSQMDFKSRAETINKGREVVLGKTPDTAIQINNNNNTTAINTMTRADRERRLKELMGDV